MVNDSSPLSTATTHRPSAVRLRYLRELTPVEKNNADVTHTPQTGDACGAPSGPVLQIQ